MIDDTLEPESEVSKLRKQVQNLEEEKKVLKEQNKALQTELQKRINLKRRRPDDGDEEEYQPHPAVNFRTMSEPQKRRKTDPVIEMLQSISIETNTDMKTLLSYIMGKNFLTIISTL